MIPETAASSTNGMEKEEAMFACLVLGLVAAAAALLLVLLLRSWVTPKKRRNPVPDLRCCVPCS